MVAPLPTWSYCVVSVGRKRMLQQFVTVPIGVVVYLPLESTLHLTDNWKHAQGRLSVDGVYQQWLSQKERAGKIAGKPLPGDGVDKVLDDLSLFHRSRRNEVQVGPFNPHHSPKFLMERYIQR